jgi:hypothetical protein
MAYNPVAKNNYHKAVVIEHKKSKDKLSKRKQKHKGTFLKD